MIGWTGAARIALYVVALLSLILAAREWGWIKFRLPEQKLQTEKVWVHDFGFVWASAMWGLHIGLGFATRITYGGFWLLVAAILALDSPAFGAVLMLSYWIGRALPVWLAPLLLSSDKVLDSTEAVFEHGYVFHRLDGIGLAWSAGLTILLAVSA
jgi:hypothetical protein